MIPGIDISHWQGEIDWKKVREAGVKFAFIKATEFPDKKISLHVDVKFEINRQGAIDNGIPWGAYHFFRTHIDPIHQAEAFCETVGVVNSLPLVLDLEVAGCKGSKLVRKVKSFVETVHTLTGRKPLIYTSGGFWRPYMTYERLSDVDWAAEYPLWMARYTSQWPAPIYPWGAWDFWQYSDRGRIPGIKASVDLNWFAGSLDDLHERFLPQGSAETQPEEEEEEPIVVTPPVPTEPAPAPQPAPVEEVEPEPEPVEESPVASEPVQNDPGDANSGTAPAAPVEETQEEPQDEAPAEEPPKETSSLSDNLGCLLSILQLFLPKKEEKKADPQQSREWIDEVVYRDKKRR